MVVIDMIHVQYILREKLQNVGGQKIIHFKTLF